MAFILSFSFRFRKHWKWNFQNSEHRELQPVLVMATWLNALMISGPFRLRLWRTIRIILHTKFINILGWSKAKTIVCHVTKIDVKGPGATQRIEVLNGKASLWGPTLYPFLTGKVPPYMEYLHWKMVPLSHTYLNKKPVIYNHYLKSVPLSKQDVLLKGLFKHSNDRFSYSFMYNSTHEPSTLWYTWSLKGIPHSDMSTILALLI